MQLRVLRPVAVVATLALSLSAGLAPTVASAQQQVFGQWSTQNQNQRTRQVTGVVTYFSQYDLRISAGNAGYGNGSGGYGNGGYGSGNYGNGGYGNGNNDNGNDNGRRHRRHRNDDNARNGNGQNGNGQYGNNGQYGQNGNGRDNDNDGDNNQNGNGRYGNNGQYGNGGYNNGRANRNEQNIRLHQGTVINPRGTTLQAGMQIRVIGHPNSDGTFEADRIDVVNGQGGYYRQ